MKIIRKVCLVVTFNLLTEISCQREVKRVQNLVKKGVCDSGWKTENPDIEAMMLAGFSHNLYLTCF